MAAVIMVLIAFAGIGSVAYALTTGTPPSHGQSIHLPSIDQLHDLVDGPGGCGAGIYPAGAQYTFERCSSSKKPISWTRCSTVTYSVDATNAPAGYRPDLAEAVSQVAAATGLHLVAVTSGGDIKITWDPSLYNPQPGTSGEAGETSFEITTGLSGSHASSASVRVSAHLQPGGGQGVGEEPILLHELGHAVGLGHFSGPVAMNPLDRGFTTYQPGDLAGLTALYDPAAC